MRPHSNAPLTESVQVDTYLAQNPTRIPHRSQHCNMPSTKDDVAVYPADSDEFAGLIAVQSELYCSKDGETVLHWGF